MLIDISHTNEKTFWDIIKLSPKPLIATHSNTRHYSNTPRNLSDEQIIALGKLNSVIGINGDSMISYFQEPSKATMEILANHMVYEKNLVSSDILCIGFDQCHRIADLSVSMIKQLEPGICFDVVPTHDKIEEFLEVLLKKGFNEDDIINILGRNAMRVFKETID
jgi:membrane dipeptidase